MEQTTARLEPRQRAAILKRIKELNQKIQDPRLSIARIDELHNEREELHAQLMADRAAR